MFKVDDIPDQVLRDIAGAYHRRLASTDTESQPADERDFQRACYLRTALEWLALWLNQQPVAPAAQAAQPVSDAYKSGGQAVADDEHVAWLRYNDHNGQRPTTLHLCDSDAPGAFKVFRESQSVADDVVRDAERYRFLRDNPGFHYFPNSGIWRLRLNQGWPAGCEPTYEQAIDAAILAAQQQKAGGE